MAKKGLTMDQDCRHGTLAGLPCAKCEIEAYAQASIAEAREAAATQEPAPRDVFPWTSTDPFPWDPS